MKKTLIVVFATLAWFALVSAPVSAAPWGSRELRQGSTGTDVKEAQIRIAGWYGNCAGVACNTHFALDENFGPMTTRAVKNFQKAHNIAVTGVVDARTFQGLNTYESADGSTWHFDWAEFAEKSAQCSTGNRGTFRGGVYSEGDTKQFVRYLMHRHEAVRAKMDHNHAINITSGYRSIQYQNCLRQKTSSAAADSQHSRGFGSDATMSGVHLGHHRGLAKTSNFHGIACYASSGHNHLDIRLDNPGGGYGWYWPGVDSAGRDQGSGGMCKGGHGSPPSTGNKPLAVGGALNPQVSSKVNVVANAEDEYRKNSSEELWMTDDSEG